MKVKSAWVRILIGMVVGSALGLILPHPLSPLDSSSWLSFIPEVVEWIAVPGNLFLGLLQMIMIPLVISSVALGIAKQGGNKDLGKLAIITIGYFVLTTAIAIVIGIALNFLIRPGKYVDTKIIQSSTKYSSTNSYRTESLSSNDKDSSREGLNYEEKEKFIPKNIENTIPKMIMEIFPTNPLKAIIDGKMLSIVVLSIILGLALTKITESTSKPLLLLLNSIQETAMAVVGWALSIAPYAVFSLMTKALYSIGMNILTGLSLYIITVLLGLGLILFMFAILGFMLGGIPPKIFISRLKELQILAFSSSSSAAVLPISLRTAIDGLKVSEKIADFVIPLGATINMNGTAIYQGIATLFLAEIFGIELSHYQLVLLVVTVVGASIGTAATPGVGIVVLSGILSGFGIPLEGIAIIFGVDRFLDMCRTAVNVTGDIVASKIIDRLITKSYFTADK